MILEAHCAVIKVYVKVLLSTELKFSQSTFKDLAKL